MDKIDSQVMPMPPKLIASFRAGFDAVANQIAIILIPITLDLFLWLGPHLQVKSMLLDFLKTLLSSGDFTSVQPSEIISSTEALIQAFASRFNLFSLLRTIPVGVPSIMSGRLPTGVPNGTPWLIDITSSLGATLIIIGLIVLGLMIGSIYYLLVSQISLNGRIDLQSILKDWSRAFFQVVSLSLALLIIFVAISIPASCAISAVTLFGLPLGQFAIFLYIGVMLWLAFPLLFSAHGIFVNHHNALASVQRSMLLTRMTFTTTSLFIFFILAISEGLNILWRVPPESSWLTLLGIAGHAFITSGLLASSFIYYRDADRWVQEIVKNMPTVKQASLHSR